IAAVRAAMGTPDQSVRAFPEAIRVVTRRNHARWVKPLYQRYWPEALEGKTARKLGFLAMDLYATAPYTVLFSSPNPPFLVGALRSFGTMLGFEPPALSRWAGRSVALLSRTLSDDTHRRIVQIAAFIAAVDHVFDHCMDGAPGVERGQRMRGVLDGSWTAPDGMKDAGAFRFLRALFVEMSAGMSAEDQQVYDVGVQRLHEYVDAEVKAMTGVPDPSGCCWRMAGVLGTIEGLFSPVWKYAGPQAREWMYSCSLFVQVMDDYLDWEKDALDIRPTPIITGFWTVETVKETFDKTLDGVVALAKASGTDDDSYLKFVKETYRMMAIEVADAMSGGGAA
ncbi:MAG TPA: class 1 isoprenoid biosynthesis enzyme, partial [Myxococcota bacterium]